MVTRVSLVMAIVMSVLSVVPGRGQTEAQQWMTSGKTATTARTGQLATIPADFERLVIAPGFLLGLNVLDDPDFSGEFRVDEKGAIALPVLGYVTVSGKTADEARVAIRERLLDEKILNNPQVQLSIIEYTSPGVTIVGEVSAPGKYPLVAPRRLVDVLTMAGGPTVLAGHEVEISDPSSSEGHFAVQYGRGTDPRQVDNVLVNPGTTLLVKRAGVVYILGSVNRPGGYVMQEEGRLSLLEAVSLASGTSQAASMRKIVLLRKNADGTSTKSELPYGQIVKGKIADVDLRASDILYFPASGIKAALINTQSVLSSVATASIYRVNF